MPWWPDLQRRGLHASLELDAPFAGLANGREGGGAFPLVAISDSRARSDGDRVGGLAGPELKGALPRGVEARLAHDPQAIARAAPLTDRARQATAWGGYLLADDVFQRHCGDASPSI